MRVSIILFFVIFCSRDFSSPCAPSSYKPLDASTTASIISSTTSTTSTPVSPASNTSTAYPAAAFPPVRFACDASGNINVDLSKWPSAQIQVCQYVSLKLDNLRRDGILLVSLAPGFARRTDLVVDFRETYNNKEDEIFRLESKELNSSFFLFKVELDSGRNKQDWKLSIFSVGGVNIDLIVDVVPAIPQPRLLSIDESLQAVVDCTTSNPILVPTLYAQHDTTTYLLFEDRIQKYKKSWETIKLESVVALKDQVSSGIRKYEVKVTKNFVSLNFSCVYQYYKGGDVKGYYVMLLRSGLDGILWNKFLLKREASTKSLNLNRFVLLLVVVVIVVVVVSTLIFLRWRSSRRLNRSEVKKENWVPPSAKCDYAIYETVEAKGDQVKSASQEAILYANRDMRPGERGTNSMIGVVKENEYVDGYHAEYFMDEEETNYANFDLQSEDVGKKRRVIGGVVNENVYTEGFHAD